MGILSVIKRGFRKLPYFRNPYQNPMLFIGRYNYKAAGNAFQHLCYYGCALSRYGDAFHDFYCNLQAVSRLISTEEAAQKGRALFSAQLNRSENKYIKRSSWMHSEGMLTFFSKTIPQALTELAKRIVRSKEYKKLIASYEPTIAAIHKKYKETPFRALPPMPFCGFGEPHNMKPDLISRKIRPYMKKFCKLYNQLFIHECLAHALIGGFLDAYLQAAPEWEAKTGSDLLHEFPWKRYYYTSAPAGTIVKGS